MNRRQTPFAELIASLHAIDGDFDRVLTVVRTAHKFGWKLFFVGNGGSSAICSHMAADYTKNGGFKALAFNDGALVTCLANDLGYENGFASCIDWFGQPNDVLFAISSSGRSPNILTAVRAANQREMSVITLSGFDADNPLRSAGDLGFYVPSRHYGTVEIAHLAICHHILDECIRLAKGQNG